MTDFSRRAGYEFASSHIRPVREGADMIRRLRLLDVEQFI